MGIDSSQYTEDLHAELIQLFCMKYTPCMPDDLQVIYYTTEEIREIFSEILPALMLEDSTLIKDLRDAGFKFYDIGSSDVVMRWCMKLK